MVGKKTEKKPNLVQKRDTLQEEIKTKQAQLHLRQQQQNATIGAIKTTVPQNTPPAPNNPKNTPQPITSQEILFGSQNKPKNIIIGQVAKPKNKEDANESTECDELMDDSDEESEPESG